MGVLYPVYHIIFTPTIKREILGLVKMIQLFRFMDDMAFKNEFYYHEPKASKASGNTNKPIYLPSKISF